MKRIASSFLACTFYNALFIIDDKKLPTLLRIATCPIQNCKICENRSPQCIECKNGYYMDAENMTCKICPFGCNECSSNTDCLNCQIRRYWMKETNSCEKCPMYCKQCSSKLTCDVCLESYHRKYKDINCIACSKNCWACNTPSDCKACEIGTYLTGEVRKQFCLACPLNCLICENENYCMKCESGFQWNAELKRCTNDCGNISCTSLGKNCDVGYYLGENLCKKCPDNNKINCEQCTFQNKGNVWDNNANICR
ncbi:hypothetical protein A3Q56_06816, partial [Intoshia linei]